MEKLRKWDDTIWLTLWDSIMKSDASTLSSSIDYYGWDRRQDHWQIYDIIARFKRWKCMQVYLTKVPLWYLKHRYAQEVGIPFSKRIRAMIRKEAKNRHIYLPLPAELVTLVLTFVYP